MNPKLAAMGIILSSARPDADFRGGQTAMFTSILDPYTVEQIEEAAAEHVAKFSGWPMSDEGLKAFRLMLKKAAAKATAGPPLRKIDRTWSERGDWTGDWSGVDHDTLVWHYAMMSRSPSPCNAEKVAEFRRVCLKRALPTVLDEARAAARKGDYELNAFMRRLKQKAVA